MTQKSEYDRCLDTMYALGRFGIVLGLSTMESILNKLGNPQNNFKCIHIAGTNGKGSVASSLSSILHTAGYKTGLYTSPHLISFNERICINNLQITDAEVIEAYKAVESVNTGERSATFFEISTAMAFYVFSRKKVDFAIIETGMGGRLDATNIVQPQLSVITNISVEHKAYLGNTISQIAFEKAGIIKSDTPVITAAKQSNALLEIKKSATKKSAPLYQYKSNFKARRGKQKGSFTYYGINNTWHKMRTNLLGKHQIDNASLTLAACELLMKDLPKLSEETIRRGLEATKWPGRLEHVSNKPYTLVDGAHNLAAIRKLAQYLDDTFSGKNITLITGILDDKEYRTMFKIILPLCNRVILTQAKSERSINPEQLLKAAEELCNNVCVIEDIPDAIKHAEKTSQPEDVICISGSLYVVGEAKEFYNSRN